MSVGYTMCGEHSLNINISFFTYVTFRGGNALDYSPESTA